MKTYKEFILEAELSWWDGGRKKATTKEAQLRRERGGTPEQQAKRSQRLKKLKSSIEKTDSRDSDTKPQKSAADKRKENAVKNTGRAQKPKDTNTKSGSLPNIKTKGDPSDVVTASRYTSGNSWGGRGTNISRTGSRIGG